MKLLFPLVSVLCCSLAFAQQCERAAHPFTYPASQTVPQMDSYHGTQVADPYRWLEDPNSAETKAWVSAQNKFTQDYLAQIPQRAALQERLTKLWNFERYSIPKLQGGRYWLTRNNGLQNQALLYTMRKLDEEPKLLLDPNTLSKDGTVALTDKPVISPDGKYLAYGVSIGGSDWNEWKVREIETGRDMPDHIKWVKFSDIAWKRDGSGFFYARFDEPNEATKLADVNYNQKLYFHKLGTEQKDDVLIYQRPDQKEWGFDPELSSDGRYLIINIGQGTERKSRMYYLDLSKKSAKVVKLLDKFDADYEFIGNQGPVFWLRTDKDAPRGRVVKLDIRNGKLQDVVPQAEQTLKEAALVGGNLLLSYLKDARGQVLQYDLGGKLVREVELPGLGSIKGFEGHINDKESFYSFTNFFTPETIYHYDVRSGKSRVLRAPKLEFDPAQYETKQVFYTSRDGTRVPMFISGKKGMALNGNNPTILYGYGGFNISLTPVFSPANLAWMEMGGVYAMANLRGGGEYGQAWHQAGTKLKKQNVFDDFIAAGEWLVANKYTQPAKLAISGGSNGGLLVGASLVQRPDLFAAALPAVGVMDMLRYHKFTIGWAWASDYGVADNAEEFKALFAYSPLHNLRAGKCYPAMMISTGDHDDRVVPAHSYKFAAMAQSVQGGAHPVLIRVDTKAGHGAGKPTNMRIEEAADKLGFLHKVLKMD